MGDVSYPLLLIKSSLPSRQWQQLVLSAQQKEFDSCNDIINDTIKNQVYTKMKEVIQSYSNKIDSVLDTYVPSTYVNNLKALNKYTISAA